MITIELVAKCDQCQAEVHNRSTYADKFTPGAAQFLQILRGLGWRLARDRSYRLSVTLCPICAMRKARPLGEGRHDVKG